MRPHMTLDIEARGALEKIIDEAVLVLPGAIKSLRSFTKDLMVTTESDFILGISVGGIMTDFHRTYSALKKAELTSEDIREELVVITRRSRDIRDAVFKAG